MATISTGSRFHTNSTTSTAVETSGAADTIADGLLGVVGDASPYALLLGLSSSRPRSAS